MHNRGLTLIEILIVSAIVGLILSFGLTIDLNSYKGDAFNTEVQTIVSILERARSQAMSNISDTNHGVCYIKPNYIIFTGDTCTTVDSELIPANNDIASNPSTFFPNQIVFTRLNGRTNNTYINVSDSLHLYKIEINNEGRINW